MARLQVAGFALAMVLSGGGTVMSPTAVAAAACSGPTCVHRDPQATGCSSGATTVAVVYPPGGGPQIELRWSSSCVANWARFNSTSYSPGYWSYWVETSDGHREDKLFNQATWTYMVNGQMAARACVQGVGTTQVACTIWR
jgi:hypothetical protein